MYTIDRRRWEPAGSKYLTRLWTIVIDRRCTVSTGGSTLEDGAGDRATTEPVPVLALVLALSLYMCKAVVVMVRVPFPVGRHRRQTP